MLDLISKEVLFVSFKGIFTSNNDGNAFLDSVVSALSLAHVNSAVVNLGVGNDQHATRFVDTARELSLQLEPASGQRNLGGDHTFC